MTARPDELRSRTNVDVVQENYEAVGRGDILAGTLWISCGWRSEFYAPAHGCVRTPKIAGGP